MGIKERYFKFCANKNLVYTLLIRQGLVCFTCRELRLLIYVTQAH